MQTDSPPASAPSSLGQRLLSQRLAQQQNVDEVAAQLKLRAAIFEAMERDDQAMLGAVEFPRGRLGSHARLVGDPQSAVDALARVDIGNARAVMVLRNGEPLDISPFRGVNASRFRLSSDGKPAPASD